MITEDRTEEKQSTEQLGKRDGMKEQKMRITIKDKGCKDHRLRVTLGKGQGQRQ